MGDLTKNFSRKEFRCKCGRKNCNAAPVDKKLVSALQKLRDYIGVPIYINSACRCAWHNRRVGGTYNSQHLSGRAADVRCDALTPKELAKCAEMVPEFDTGGIGTYETFVHLDVRGKRARWRG